MTLAEYLDAPGAPTTEKLAALSNVSKVTLGRVKAGYKLQLYRVAKRVSVATGGKVTVAELCE